MDEIEVQINILDDALDLIIDKICKIMPTYQKSKPLPPSPVPLSSSLKPHNPTSTGWLAGNPSTL
jgi:hypothetical protein